MKRRNRKAKNTGKTAKNAPAAKVPEPAGSTRPLSGVLLLALAVIIGAVLAVLESVKEAASG